MNNCPRTVNATMQHLIINVDMGSDVASAADSDLAIAETRLRRIDGAQSRSTVGDPRSDFFRNCYNEDSQIN